MNKLKIIFPKKTDKTKLKIIISKLIEKQIINKNDIYEKEFINEGQFLLIYNNNKLQDFIILTMGDNAGRNTLLLQPFSPAYCIFEKEYKEKIKKAKILFLIDDLKKITKFNYLYINILIKYFEDTIIFLDNFDWLKIDELNINKFIEYKFSSIKKNNKPTNLIWNNGIYVLYSKFDGTNINEIIFICWWFIKMENHLKIMPINKYKNNKWIIEILKNNYVSIDKKNELEIKNENIIHKGTKIRNQLSFKINILNKYKKMECYFCKCSVEKMIESAHIKSIKQIKKDKNIDFEEKKRQATDGNNGLFLCVNHHKSFDRNILKINKDNIWEFNKELIKNKELNKYQIEWLINSFNEKKILGQKMDLPEYYFH